VSLITGLPVFKLLDNHTHTVCTLIPPKVIKANQNPLEEDELRSDHLTLGPGRSDEDKLDDHMLALQLTDDCAIELLKIVDLLGEQAFVSLTIGKALKAHLLFSLKDVPLDCSKEEIVAIEELTGLNLALPKTTHHWDKMTSYKAMSRIFSLAWV
jgi:hypothetical protein